MKLAWSPQLPGLAPLPFSRRPNIRNLFQVLVKIQKHLLKELDGTLPVSCSLDNVNAMVRVAIIIQKGSRAPDEGALLLGLPLVDASGHAADIGGAVLWGTAVVEAVIVAAV